MHHPPPTAHCSSDWPPANYFISFGFSFAFPLLYFVHAALRQSLSRHLARLSQQLGSVHPASRIPYPVYHVPYPASRITQRVLRVCFWLTINHFTQRLLVLFFFILRQNWIKIYIFNHLCSMQRCFNLAHSLSLSLFSISLYTLRLRLPPLFVS